jgi:ATP-dependent Clp protease ATP-binding subunit ClpC
MFDRFSQNAKSALNRARMESQRLQHAYLGTEHLLLGLLGSDECTAVQLIWRMGIRPAELRTEVERLVKSGPPLEQTSLMPFTERAKRVLEFTMQEVGDLRDNYIGTGHLLLGLLNEHDGVAGQALSNLGATRDRARVELLELRAERYEDHNQPAVDLEDILDRLRTASALLQQRGKPEAARKIDQIISDLQSRP